ncbi:MAG TPA: nucleotidyltransferase family protein [Dissulfurispiraceae bacterium]|nr:nucleotidyltransferase family protein [Dissulfurispiraceae bacterium]
MIQSFGRHILHQRHQLSHEQIDALLGESRAAEFSEERALMLGRLHGLMQVAAALESAGVSFTVLKGFPLSQKIYGNPFMRITGDLDLLLDPPMIAPAIDALTALGYIPAYDLWPPNKKGADKLMRFRNQFAMKHPESGIVAELHWRLFYYPVIAAARMEKVVRANLTTIIVEGRTFRVLNPELDLLYLIVHGGMHGYSRLKWLADVVSLANQQRFSAKRFMELTATFNAGRMVGLYNRLKKDWPGGAKQLPGAAATPSFLEKNARRMIFSQSDTSFQTPVSLLRYFYFVASSFPGLGYKWRILVYAWRSLWINSPERPRLLNPRRLFKLPSA